MESELIGRGHAAFTGEFGANTREFGAILVSLVLLLVNLERILESLMLLLVNLERILVSLMLLLVNLEQILVKHRNEHAFFHCHLRCILNSMKSSLY
ncbi:hypothetical protein J2Y73_001501 [Peribacillus frigoritolerans]|jgi:hypothetical protein|nr:hypothetical protein [Peribacillus frigoritolerans]